MFTYPELTADEQASLPQLKAKPEAIPSKFEDSTHHLYYCHTVQGDMVLKVCNTDGLAHAPFWQAANHLFAADFPNSLGDVDYTHQFLQQQGTLIVPELVASQPHRYVLTRFLAGQDLVAAEVSDQSVSQLARHIAALHQWCHPHWGNLHKPKFAASEWPNRLHDTLLLLSQRHQGLMQHPLVEQALAQTHLIQESQFVPMMPDLRWDQFRYLDNHQLALLDLDAFVIAPRSLDLVLIEYILTPAQLSLFKQTYTHTHAWPDAIEHKTCYQLLLFLMNVLGETNLEKWMHRV